MVLELLGLSPPPVPKVLELLGPSPPPVPTVPSEQLLRQQALLVHTALNPQFRRQQVALLLRIAPTAPLLIVQATSRLVRLAPIPELLIGVDPPHLLQNERNFPAPFVLRTHVLTSRDFFSKGAVCTSRMASRC